MNLVDNLRRGEETRLSLRNYFAEMTNHGIAWSQKSSVSFSGSTSVSDINNCFILIKHDRRLTLEKLTVHSTSG